MKKYLYLLLLFLVVGCNPSQKKEEPKNEVFEPTQEILEVIGTYKGVLPCANCSGIQTLLELRANGGYHKEQVYINDTSEATQHSFDDFGKWCYSEDSTYIELNYDSPDMDMHEYWEIINNNEIRLMDKNINTIESDDNYSLKRE